MFTEKNARRIPSGRTSGVPPVADQALTPQPYDEEALETGLLDASADAIESSEFPIDAFAFVQDGLRHTVDTLERNNDQLEIANRHVTGRELCIGLRDYALGQYGMLARTVLERWGIERTDDFGQIVFAMVDAGLMRANDNDTTDDFNGVYRFDEAFDDDIVGVG
jgi:uncharacterized repeat protein (TIGR04138 family)